MNYLTEEKIREIEDELTKIIVKQYDLSTEYLLFNNTNFFTYLDTANPSTLGKLGKSKQKRSDLKIIGLSMMVSPENNIPLFHETYSGNRNDAKRFSEVIVSLKKRYKQIQRGNKRITLVFDKGNNNEDNIEELLNEEPCSFHFVGGLRLSQCADLLDIPKEEYIPLDGECFKGATAYRTTRNMYKKETSVVITYNPELFKEQLEGVMNNTEKCKVKMFELQESLAARADGKVTKGKKPTIDSITKRISGILSSQHMKEVFDYTVSTSKNGLLRVTYSLNNEKLEDVKYKIQKNLDFSSITVRYSLFNLCLQNSLLKIFIQEAVLFQTYLPEQKNR